MRPFGLLTDQLLSGTVNTKHQLERNRINYIHKKENKFYVTDGNIMYLTDASRSLISCVIQHYAPVVGWGGEGTDA
jgi:hypothetical protein